MEIPLNTIFVVTNWVFDVLACKFPGGHSHICPVQVCAAVKTPLFDLTRA